MKISFKQVEAFVSVADLRSFRRAAERLNTTQPNISTRIAGLESRLGVTLMERDAGSVRLTPKGKALVPHARRIFQSIDTFIIAADDTSPFEGILRLGVTEMIVHTWLGPFLKALKERFPNVLVELNVDLSSNLSAALFNRSLDLAIPSEPINRQTTGSVDLGGYPLIWVASPELGVADPIRTISDFAAYPVLTHARGYISQETAMSEYKFSAEDIADVLGRAKLGEVF